jgi:hypothetical protein
MVVPAAAYVVALSTVAVAAAVTPSTSLPDAADTADAADALVPLTGWRLAGSNSGISIPCEDDGGPSVVHVDLQEAALVGDAFDGTEIDDPRNRWVMNESNWTYTAQFTSVGEQPNDTPLLLVAQGLDTLVTIRHNGRVVGRSDNMHLRVVVPLEAVHQGANTLSFSFANPVPYAYEQRRLHPCPCASQTCQDHKNHSKPCKCCKFNATQYPIYSWAPGRIFVRKAQSHYGWCVALAWVGVSEQCLLCAACRVTGTAVLPPHTQELGASHHAARLCRRGLAAPDEPLRAAARGRPDRHPAAGSAAPHPAAHGRELLSASSLRPI